MWVGSHREGEGLQPQTLPSQAAVTPSVKMDLQSIAVAKGTSMVVLGGVAFLITILPVVFHRLFTSHKFSKKNSLGDVSVLSLFLSFGGGVLLCTTFLHLLPEVTENIEALQKAGKLTEDFPLPLPELIMCIGFFTMYIIEEVVHKFLHLGEKNNRSQGCENSLSDTLEPNMSLSEAYKRTLNQDALKVVFTPPHDEDISIFPKSAKKNYGSSCVSNAEVNHNHHDHYDHDHQHHDLSDHNLDHHQHAIPKEPRSLRELLMVLALSVHEGFEGLAIGLEGSVGAVWYMLAAVAVHKCVIAFCIGIELVNGRVSLVGSVIYAVIYSCASPLGIAVGLLLSSTDRDATTLMLSVGLQGLATGTLLYVVFFEVLHRDSHGGPGLFQLLSVLAGFFLMAILIVLIDA